MEDMEAIWKLGSTCKTHALHSAASDEAREKVSPLLTAGEATAQLCHRSEMRTQNAQPSAVSIHNLTLVQAPAPIHGTTTANTRWIDL